MGRIGVAQTGYVERLTVAMAPERLDGLGCDLYGAGSFASVFGSSNTGVRPRTATSVRRTRMVPGVQVDDVVPAQPQKLALRAPADTASSHSASSGSPASSAAFSSLAVSAGDSGTISTRGRTCIDARHRVDCQVSLAHAPRQRRPQHDVQVVDRTRRQHRCCLAAPALLRFGPLGSQEVVNVGGVVSPAASRPAPGLK